MRYEITKSRPDGYYRYIRYDDNDSSILKMVYDRSGELVKVKFNVGWSLYSKQETEEEKIAWLNAVKKYHEENQVTGLCDLLHSYIDDIRAVFILDDKKFPPNKSLLMPSLADLASLKEGDICDDEFLKKLKNAGKPPLPTPKEMIHYAYKAGRFNVKNELNKLAYSYVKLGLTAFVNPVLDMAEEMIDTFFGFIDMVYTEIIKLCCKAYRLYQLAISLKDPEERKRIFKLFLEEIKKYGKDIYEFLYQILCIETFIEIFKTLRNLWNSRKEIWKSLVAKLKALVDFDYKSLGSEIINNLAGVILGFLPLLGALLGAFFAKQCSDEEERKALQKSEAMFLTNSESDDYDDAIKKSKKKQKEKTDKFKKSSIVYSLCDKEKEYFSFHKHYKENDKNNNIDDSSIEDSSKNDDSSIDINMTITCKVSMCDYEDPTDFDYFIDEAGRNPRLITIEFDKSFVYSFTVNIGQIVRVNNIIGYISGIPVKSNFDFIVIEIKENYIVGKYYYDNIEDLVNGNEEDVQNKILNYANEKIDTSNTNEFEQLQLAFSKKFAAEDFILNYAPYCRIADCALNSATDPKDGNPLHECIDEYYKFVDNQRTNSIEELKRVAGKDNVQSKANSGKLYSLKEEIDKSKASLVEETIHVLRTPYTGFPLKTRGVREDLALYSYYMEYLYSERFVYNDDNEFIVKLHNLLSEFISERMRLELNKQNFGILISDFNTECSATLGKYLNTSDYYKKFKSLFTSDYYEIGTNEIIPKKDKSNSQSLYNRFYNYLTSLTSFTPNESKNQIVVGEDTDVAAMINQFSKETDTTSYNKEDQAIRSSLKRIVLKYITLQKIENGVNEYSDINQELDEEKNTQPNTTLRSLAQNESRKIRALLNEAIAYYYANKDSDIIELFKPLMKVNWPVVFPIYKNNEKCDFYFFSPITNVCPPKTTLKDLKEIENDPLIHNNSGKNISPIGLEDEKTYGIGDIQYWLRYCGVATGIHCMLPMYWSTGLVILGVPIPMPVIYIPIFALEGRVTVVFGIGLCGIMPMPMIYFANVGSLLGSILIPINLLVDMMIKMTQEIANMGDIMLEGMIEPLIKSLDAQIRQMEEEKEDIPYQISQIKSLYIKGKKKVLDSVHEIQGDDKTFKAELQAEDENIVIQEDNTDGDSEEYITKDEKTVDKIIDNVESFNEQCQTTSSGGSLRDWLKEAKEHALNREADKDDYYYHQDEVYTSSNSTWTDVYIERSEAVGSGEWSENTDKRLRMSNSEKNRKILLYFDDNPGLLTVTTDYIYIPTKKVLWDNYMTEITVPTTTGKHTTGKKYIAGYDKNNKPILKDLYLLDGDEKTVTIHKKVAAQIKQALTKMGQRGFIIKTLSGFDYRNTKTTKGGYTNSASIHALGLAIDINGRKDLNPFNQYGKLLNSLDDYNKQNPKINWQTQMRSLDHPAVKAMFEMKCDSHWGWGGNWNSCKDWMHFSATNT